MRFGRLDLNLLVALDVLLAERNVTVAADRLCLSQSAMSGALARLREYFDDELLINTGRKMILTPRAESLVTPVRNVLLQIKTTITTTPEFLPAESDRNFSIVMSDYSLDVMVAPALAQIALLAPNLTFEISPIGDRPIGQLESREIDLLITIDQAVSDQHPKATLFTDDYVVIAWDQNTEIGEFLDRETYGALGHVTVQFGKARLPTLEEYFLQTLKIKRRIEMFAPSFTSVPRLIAGTNRIATVHRRMAQKAAETMPLRLYDVPAEMPKVTQVVQWHASASDDQALMWVVKQIQTYAQHGSISGMLDQLAAVAE
ncbi:MAG: LysR family transcriptional regulator [Asticcacaulis sp.]|uniref:LysR family transcriptional regulator n=1 Tax=Asticcacaulis sp. TaxID=1872648 RepID=UPI0039E51AAC